MKSVTVFFIMWLGASFGGIAIGGMQSKRHVDLRLDAIVVAYEKASPPRKFVGTARSQLLLLRVNRLIKGNEDSRYIAVRYHFGGYDQPLKGADLQKGTLRRFSLTRDRDCDTALSDFIYIKQVTTTGEDAGRVLRLKLLSKDVTALREDMIVPCYDLFPAHSNHRPNGR